MNNINKFGIDVTNNGYVVTVHDKDKYKEKYVFNSIVDVISFINDNIALTKETAEFEKNL